MDGLAWERIALPAELEAASLVSLIADPRGDFLLFANSYDAENVLRPVVMRSTDGLSWEIERVDLPRRLYLTRVVNGPLGYLLAGRDDGPGGLWLSPDGFALGRLGRPSTSASVGSSQARSGTTLA